MYELDGVAVRELITNVKQGTGLFRSFQIGVADKEVWFVAGAIIIAPHAALHSSIFHLSRR